MSALPARGAANGVGFGGAGRRNFQACESQCRGSRDDAHAGMCFALRRGMTRQFSLSTLVALLAQASVGCGTTPSPDATSEAALEVDTASFELIQAGFFHNDVARQSAAWRLLPKLVHIGFADARPPLAVREGDDGARPSWEGVQDIPIEYDAEGANKAVVVTVPSEHRGKAFALFAMKVERFDGSMGASAQ